MDLELLIFIALIFVCVLYLVLTSPALFEESDPHEPRTHRPLWTKRLGTNRHPDDDAQSSRSTREDPYGILLPELHEGRLPRRSQRPFALLLPPLDSELDDTSPPDVPA